MNKLGYVIGKSAFWITWPGLWLMLRWSHRTRLLLVCGDEFLVVRGWLGSGLWGLPGGGLHRHEKPVAGLLREVEEEIGVRLLPSQVTAAFDRFARQNGFKFHYYAFAAEVSEKPAVNPQPREIAEIKWQSLKVPTVPLNSETQALREWWLNKT